MIVCIAEKPSVARDIAQVLGAHKRCDGYLEGNGYCVTWTYGHLCCLKAPNDYRPEWQHWHLGTLPMIPPRFGIKLIPDTGYTKQFGVIASLIAKADCIINCGDAGQEGELIQRWVMQKAGTSCPVKRLWISSLTEEAIKEGFKNLKDQDEYKSLYEAGLARAIGDWLLGMNATRLYTLKYGGKGQVLSVGRVQTPTLALIVERQKQIEDFLPRKYWELKTRYRDVTFSTTRTAFDTKEQGEAALQKIQNKPLTIKSITPKKGKELPPKLFDLTLLQVECNKTLGYSADATLKLAQSLYEKKVITYPRVDTTYLTDDIYKRCPGILKGLQAYHTLTAPLLTGGKLQKSKKVFDNSKVSDHHAIIPTGVSSASLSTDEQAVFDRIARRFIAIFYPDCLFQATVVEAVCEDVAFKATGKQVLQYGWKEVIKETETEKAKAEEEQTLPVFTPGESGPHTPLLAEKNTTPPKPYTEGTLLRAMETAGKLVEREDLREALKENGIGRPSTRAAIIETLLKRGYIKKERKSLYPTPLGVALISVINEDLLKSAELTGVWEKKLREIEKHTYSAEFFLNELKEMINSVVNSVLATHHPADQNPFNRLQNK